MDPAALGEFTIEGLLGEGGSSLVYAARRGDDEIALKVLHPDLGLSPREIERFLAEAKMLESVRHRAIVELRESGVLPDGRPYLAMPRLRGRSLAARLAVGPLAPSKALALFADVADAVAALHAKGLIHRDIKPENVLWLDDADRLVLLDLGIARDAEGAPSTTTRAGLARGTPQYMAPERLFGQRASVRTDVYELALLLYVMLAGRAPWRDDDPQGRLSPEIDPRLRATLPETLVATLSDALALDATRRPASVDELSTRVRAAAAWLPGGVAIDATSDTRLVVTPRGPISSDASLALAPTELHAPALAAAAHTDPPATPPAVSVAEAHPTLRSASQAPGALPRRAGAVALVVAAASVVGVAGTLALVRARRAASEHARETSTARVAEPSPPPSDRAPSPDTPNEAETARPPVAPSATQEPSSAPSTLPSSTPPSPPSARPPTPPSPTPSASSPPAPAGSTSAQPPMPASCAGLVALFCSPGSNGTPEECASWKGNVARWRSSLPPNVVDSTCQAALDASKSGLAARKNTKVPR